MLPILVSNLVLKQKQQQNSTILNLYSQLLKQGNGILREGSANFDARILKIETRTPCNKLRRDLLDENKKMAHIVKKL